MLQRISFLFLCTFLVFRSYSQNRQLLTETSWSGTHSPIKKGSEIYFQGDTLYLIDLEGIKPPDSYLFRQKNDTVSLFMIDEFSFDCRDEVPGLYKISWANNGEKLLFKPIHDPCMPRFTQLISESPWFRIRKNALLRNDWFFLDPEKDRVPGVGLYDTYKWLKFRKSSPVKMAIVGGQVDILHEDLKGILTLSELIAEPNSMATYVAGIIGAQRGNGKGVEGIADNVLLSNFVVNQNDQEEIKLAAAILESASNGCKIILLTDGLPDKLLNSKIILSAIKAVDKSGALVFIPTSEKSLLSSYAPLPPNAVPVLGYELKNGSSNRCGALIAPAFSIYSTLPGDDYGVVNGVHTSGAIAAGMAALLSSYFPKLTSWQIRRILMESGKTNAQYPGLVNMKKAYDLALKQARKK